jgi:hypothetical protein
VATLSQTLAANYMTAFQNWAAQFMKAKIPNTNPLQPPAEYLAVGASNGWSYVIRGTEPVCAMLAIPQAAVASPPLPERTDIRSVPLGDTMPVGFILTAADGTRWQKQGSLTPLAWPSYYAKVA